jgi:hypothetical protein
LKLRDINRWHIAMAALITTMMSVVVWLSLMKTCADPALGKPTYCTVEQTLAWLRSGGDWKLWTYIALLGIGLLSAIFSKSK